MSSLSHFRLRLQRPGFRWIALMLALSGTAWLSACSRSAEAQGGPPPTAPVSVVPAVQRTISDSEEFSGRIEAAEFVELRARLSGTVDKVHFNDGAMVKRGDLLFTIDSRPFAAELARAESLLVSARARAELAKAELTRAQKLLESNAVSRQEFEQLTAGAQTSDADIQAAQAQVRSARVNLDYAAIRAPISGRVSRANVTPGNLVNEQIVLTTIASQGKVYAYFDSSEQTFLRVRDSKERTPVVRMGLANEAGHPHEGRIDFVDNRLNPQTGTIRMRAVFDNARNQFTPGLAARLVLSTSTPYTAVMVPERAIGTDQTKKTVFVVAADGKPQFREVKLGPLLGGMRVVLGNGVKPGENVIVDGLQRVIPGMPVTPTVLQADAQGMPIFPAPAAPQR